MTAIQDIPLKTVKGDAATLADHAGKVLLVVNTASKCGLTPQYSALEATQGKYEAQGFSVLGFPANDFGAQEPGTDDEIAEFCSTNFDVSFPIYSKIAVAGAERHPLYQALIDAQPVASPRESGLRERLASHGVTPAAEGDILWNFEKFLISRDGQVVARFNPDVTPDDPLVTNAIEAELAR